MQSRYSGVYDGLCYISGGVVDDSFRGTAPDAWGRIWSVDDSCALPYSGVFEDPGGSLRVFEEGRQKAYTGFAPFKGEWFFFDRGSVITETAVIKGEVEGVTGCWLTEEGKVSFGCFGVVLQGDDVWICEGGSCSPYLPSLQAPAALYRGGGEETALEVGSAWQELPEELREIFLEDNGFVLVTGIRDRTGEEGWIGLYENDIVPAIYVLGSGSEQTALKKIAFEYLLKKAFGRPARKPGQKQI